MKKLKLLVTVLLVSLAIFSSKEAGPKNSIKYDIVKQDKVEQYETENLVYNFKSKLNKTLQGEVNNKEVRKKLLEKYTDRAIMNKIIYISEKFSIKPMWLIRVILKESKGNPKAVNKYSGATGIIQWMPSTAKYLGTTVKHLQEMSVLKQLNFVEKYLDKISNKHNINSYENLYLAVFYPKALGKQGNFIIGNNDKLVAQNKAVDYDKNGVITVDDFKKYALN